MAPVVQISLVTSSNMDSPPYLGPEYCLTGLTEKKKQKSYRILPLKLINEYFQVVILNHPYK
jgi:hypothetical protein